MAAPGLAGRLAPDLSIHLFDGYQTFVAISTNAGALLDDKPGNWLWEVTVTPVGIDGGDPINQDTMWNLVWHLVTPRHLKTLMEVMFTAAYDPDGYSGFIAWINIVTNITVYYPDGSTVTFWGFMRKFEPQEVKEGEMPKVNVTVTPSLMDPSAPNGRPVIVGPVLTAVPGT